LGDSYTSRDGDNSLSARIADSAATFDDRFFDRRTGDNHINPSWGVYDNHSIGDYLQRVSGHGGVFDYYNLANTGNNASHAGLQQLLNSANQGLTRGTNNPAEFSQRDILNSLLNEYNATRRSGKKLG